MKGKALSNPPSRREWATSQMANVEGGQINLKLRILSLPSANGLLIRADEQVEVRATSSP